MTGQVQEVSRSVAAVVATNLRVAQAEAQMSNVALAAAVGVAPRTIGKWRRAEIEITIASLERVARALDRQLPWFLSDHTAEAAA